MPPRTAPPAWASIPCRVPGRGWPMTQRASRSTSSASPRIPTAPSGRGIRRLDGVRRRTARQRRLRGCAAARGVRARSVGERHRARLPGDRPPAAPRVRRAMAPRHRSTSGITPSRWRLPGVIAGAITAALLYLLDPHPVPPPARRGTRRPVRAGRRDVLRPVADRHERRVRRSLHHRGLHPVRRDLDRLVARPRGRSGSDAPPSGCCSASPSPANGWRPMRSARSSC